MNTGLALLALQAAFGALLMLRQSEALSHPAARLKRQANDDAPKVTQLLVDSFIRNRFADTKVTCRIENQQTEAKEATFSLQLPDAAFIANFSMMINGELRAGEVKEKAEAQRTYNRERQQGNSAGHVAATARDSNQFSLQVNIAANSSAIFYLTYQELLRRELGFYKHKININPGQVVPEMFIQVNIDETKPISELRTPKIRYNLEGGQDARNFEENEIAVYDQPEPHRAEIRFEPTVEEQRSMSDKGVVGQFLVQYDVQRNLSADIEVVDGYFVHFFAPENLPPLPKSVVFVLDVSGSMSGRKIAQLRDSMETILGDLREMDFFNIITFNGRVRMWRREGLVAATETNILEATEFATRLYAGGSTNINDALTTALGVIRDIPQKMVPMIVFLTDGQPTAGETNPRRILSNIEEHNSKEVAIYSLSYGSGADFHFLKKLSLQNFAFAKKIYEDSDASLQLQNFFENIASPVMKDIEFRYVGNSDIEFVSQAFPIVSKNTDLVFAGKLNYETIPPPSEKFELTGTTIDGLVLKEIPFICVYPLPRIFTTSTTTQSSVVPVKRGLNMYSLQRIWAYLTIKELLNEKERTDNATMQAELKTKALALSLKYNFVTPLTSMVVTQGQEAEDGATELQESAHDQRQSRGRTPYSGPGRPQYSRQRSRPGTSSFGSAQRQYAPPLPNFLSGAIAPHLGLGRGIYTFTAHAANPVVQDPSLKLKIRGVPVCLNLPATQDIRLILVNDTRKDVLVTIGLRKGSPFDYINGVKIQSGNSSIVSLSSPHGNLRVWGQLQAVGDTLTRVPSTGAAIVRLSSGWKIKINRSFYPGNFNGIALDFEFNQRSRCGQFSGILADALCSTIRLRPSSPNRATLIFPSRRRRMPVQRNLRWPFSRHTAERCWYADSDLLSVA